MSTLTTNHTAAAEVQSLLDRWAQAVRAHGGVDIEAIMACYAPDIVAFDAVAKLQFNGVEEYGKHWRHCVTLAPGPMIFELHDVEISAGEDVAFAHYLQRCGGIDSETGEERTSWLRGTSCFRKIEGEWRIVHEHLSVPFDMETGVALLALTP